MDIEPPDKPYIPMALKEKLGFLAVGAILFGPAIVMLSNAHWQKWKRENGDKTGRNL